jgi:hypothetical protein
MPGWEQLGSRRTGRSKERIMNWVVAVVLAVVVIVLLIIRKKQQG